MTGAPTSVGRVPAGTPWLAGLLVLIALVAGCGVVAQRPAIPRDVDIAAIPDPVPRQEPLSRYGNPDSYVVHGRRYYPLKSAAGFVERGIASWYGSDFHGRRTSSGEPYDMYQMTAAHKTLPLPTYARVTNLSNGRTAIVRVNDRGPFHENRIIDLSYAVAAKLGIADPGTGLVEVRAIESGKPLVAPPSVPLRLADRVPGLASFYLQVGAFRDYANAQRMRDKLKGLVAQPAVIATAQVGGIPMHRVRIGPLVDVDSADRIVESLNRIGVLEHTVVLN
ncbi:MAG: septal ring lytic transglycosylase RlpA family protein [Gammaproteobacteria bacterium]|nr:septal ring lytic transglycosylase RlpA family protein [Gammaproteobacteria bacterium]